MPLHEYFQYIQYIVQNRALACICCNQINLITVSMFDNWIHRPIGGGKHPSSSIQVTKRNVNETVLSDDKMCLGYEGNETGPCAFVGTFVPAVRKCNMN